MAVIDEEIARTLLGDVPGDKQFWCSDGKILKNLPELATALVQMSPETFKYHSNSQKKDFSNWVKDVIGDEKLARDLINATQVRAAKVVNDRVVWLKSKLEANRRIK